MVAKFNFQGIRIARAADFVTQCVSSYQNIKTVRLAKDAQFQNQRSYIEIQVISSKLSPGLHDESSRM